MIEAEKARHQRQVLADGFGTDYRKGPEDFEEVDMRRNKYDRERERRTRACVCPLCVWAVTPVLTFAEFEVRRLMTEQFNRRKTWPRHTENA